MTQTKDVVDSLPADALVECILHALERYEFRTFVVGFDRDAGYDRAAHERRFRTLKRKVGERISLERPGTDADFLRPDVRVDVGSRLELRVQAAPIFVAGRYRKLSREIPATRWVHHACRGRGCPSCRHTGSLCGPSIQELLSEPMLRLSGGQRTHLHTLGREDTDARMLGRGRPFVMEVHHPLRRTLDLEEIARSFHASSAGLAEVEGLASADPESRAAVKSAVAEKTYRVWLDAGIELPHSAAEIAASLAGATIHQLSPTRVCHRRGRSALRTKHVVESQWLGEVDGRYAWEVRVKAGTYVKELVSGDGGRTRPSLAELFGVELTCAALDVLEVHWCPPWEDVSSASPRREPEGNGLESRHALPIRP